MRGETIVVEDGDGHQLAVEAADGGDGFPLLVHAGSPGSRKLYAPMVDLAAESGFRVFSYDRPGYGLSTPQPGRRVGNAARDALAIFGELDLGRFATWGFSGGGPFALACAALLPDQVVGACVFASLGPSDAPDLDYASGRSDGFREELDMFVQDRASARSRYSNEADNQLQEMSDPASWMRWWGDRAGTDHAHSQELADHLASNVNEASRQNDEGWWEDHAAFLSPWGFDLGGIRCPVQIWHGGRDLAVPIVHGRWMADHITHADVHLIAEEDHSTIEVNHQADAIEWLRRILQAP